ncbi:hypothetical protein SAMN04488034_102391 [Salinimicrobium catena]|uniref:Uncharacterized protein n=1 Tax=Salinimicrobium catena TaxID=390640 RepID=A0A1H5LRE5_9FLAO|nr:hypothetical protein [Salinimicrobium catena]SDL13311.1 hypothetical protein SAMN04488140_102391 [Salinimicrobium catena]SEE79665.1 hypothetical protein SAMN04488034_102391 [Salinimicrobium catena]
MSPIIKRAFVGGAVSTIIMGVGTYILGEVSGYEAKALLTSSLSGINMLCNTVILGSSTILALMLTLLSLSRSARSKLSNAHYNHVLMVARTDTILIVAAVVTFLFLNLPITESKEVPTSWYSIVYYISLGMASILGGGFIAVVTMLYGTISNVIAIVGFKQTDHPLVEHDEDDNEVEDDQNEEENEEEEQKRKKKVKEAEDEVNK